MRIADYFGLGLTQYQLDFVNIPIETDIGLYVDPYAFEVSGDEFGSRCNSLVVGYFELVLATMRAGKEEEAKGLLSRLSEPNETHFGLSKNEPAGRSIGRLGAAQIYDRLRQSQAVQTGLLQDLSDCELLIPGIGWDKISDITTNIVRSEFVEFSKAECKFYGIPTRPVAQTLWNPDKLRWESRYVDLPIVPGKRGEDTAVILVPKQAVRLRLAYDTGEYYRGHVLDFLASEHVEAGSSLIHTLRSGAKKVLKQDLKDLYPLSSEFIFDFSMKHEDVFQAYKETVEDPGYPTNASLESREPDPQDFDVRAAIEKLAEIPTGAADATRYHRQVRGIVEALFYPELVHIAVETEVNEGRKRIDLLADNPMIEGFFGRLGTRFRIDAPFVPIECKNYTDDVGNPELDQLIGRLGGRIGQFGILLCRHIEDRALMLKRQKDAITMNKVHILVFDDRDVRDMGTAFTEGRIDDFLDMKMRELLL